MPENNTATSRDVPHRKNAAEWVMWLFLLPFIPIVILVDKIRSRRKPS